MPAEIEPAAVPVPGRLYQTPGIVIISFGYQWGAPPEAHVLFDVRRFHQDLGPGLRDRTAEDRQVQRCLEVDHVVRDLCSMLELIAVRYSYQGDDVVIAVGCPDGRQLSPVIASELRTLLGYEGNPCTVYDRDIRRPAAVNTG